VVRKLAKNALERAGYRVLAAESGQAAIDLFNAADEQVSLVLLDMAQRFFAVGRYATPYFNEIRTWAGLIRAIKRGLNSWSS
jgi:CheY-like chemotaxis protein